MALKFDSQFGPSKQGYHWYYQGYITLSLPIKLNDPADPFPNASPYPINQKDRAPMQASNIFFVKMFLVFFIDTVPTSTNAKPD